jgi:hypothetical protein
MGKDGRRLVLVALALGSAAWAQDATPAPEPMPAQPIPDAPPVVAGAPMPQPKPLAPVEPAPLFPKENAAAGVHVGVHAALNVGLLSVDLHVDRSYTFIGGNIGVPLLSNGSIGAFSLGSGYSLPLSPPDESMWVLDLFGVVTPGWQARWDPFYTVYSNTPFVGLGVGVGFRYLHWSGFTFGIKAPVFGAAINGGASTSESVLTFYLSGLIAVPIISFGLRW